jgi:ATP-binding cassette, subfamily B, bacterial
VLSHRNPRLFRRVLHEARPFWLSMLAILVLDLLAAPLFLLTPLPLKIAVDSSIGDKPLPGPIESVVGWWTQGSASKILVVAVVLLLAIAAMTQLQALLAYVLRSQAGERMTLGFRAKLFRHAQRLSLTFHDVRGTSDSIFRIQYDAPALQWITVYGVLPFAAMLFTIAATFYVTFRISWELAVVAVCITPFLAALSHAYTWGMRPRYTDAIARESSALRVVQEALTAVRVVKAFGREDDEQGLFVDRSRRGVRARVRLSFSEGAFGFFVNMATAAGAASVLFLGVRGVEAGTLTLGELLMVMAYLTQLYTPIQNISKDLASMQSSFGSAQRAFELLDQLPEVPERPDAKRLARARGAVEFRGVTFAYGEAAPALRDITIAVRPGARVGIAGRTGAGKTTLVSLLMRFYDPAAGQILLDGVDLREYRLADLRNQFSMVLQEPVLFAATIAENIAYAHPGASDAEIADAARAANAHDFISALADGYETPVGERGMQLSGGERQRLSLARAFLKDAPVLILDEPTSSVDVKTEAVIMEATRRLMDGRTTFMIAHRLGTLDLCDVLVELDSGVVTGVTEHHARAKGRVPRAWRRAFARST